MRHPSVLSFFGERGRNPQHFMFRQDFSLFVSDLMRLFFCAAEIHLPRPVSRSEPHVSDDALQLPIFRD